MPALIAQKEYQNVSNYGKIVSVIKALHKKYQILMKRKKKIKNKPNRKMRIKMKRVKLERKSKPDLIVYDKYKRIVGIFEIVRLSMGGNAFEDVEKLTPE